MKLPPSAIKTAICFGLATLIWTLGPPAGLSEQAFLLFAIFFGTIALVISGAQPMGACTLMGLLAAVLTNALPFEKAFSGYSSQIVWLVLVAFFISKGFIQTGLGRRLALYVIKLLGKNTLGLGYGLTLSELILAPAIPSITARSGGIIYPIAQSLSHAFASYSDDGTRRKLGAYLITVAFQASVVTSAMFVTAIAPNPLLVTLASEVGADLGFARWALAALVPGLICLSIGPYLIYKIYPPEIKETKKALDIANRELKELGPMGRHEKTMLLTFVGLLVFWIFGKDLGISVTETALLGLSLLLLTGTLKWQDLVKVGPAWETFVWFGALVAMAQGLNELGVAAWFGDSVAGYLGSFSTTTGTLILFLIYFYVHYFFASATAHVGALYLPFVMVAIQLGADPFFAAMLFACGSSLFGGLTHYGCGSAPILFGSGFVTLKEWWRVGFVMSLVNITIFLVVGTFWWRLIGYI